jgi:glutathione S-transferase
MSFTLYLHPLSSYCHKVLIALYESSLPFESRVVNLGDPADRAEFAKVWPLAKFPVLHDATQGRTVPESTTIIEYLARCYPAQAKLLPVDPDLALQARATDRFYDLHIHQPMQKVVSDLLRPADGHDPIGVQHAQAQIKTALGIAEEQMAGRRWALGDPFSMADCAAAPPLFFINIMTPLGEEFPNVSAYLDRLKARPSYARTLTEAQPYLSMFPGHPRKAPEHA